MVCCDSLTYRVDSPLGAVADMICALTRTIGCLDRQPPDDTAKYVQIRATLLNQSRVFLDLAKEYKVCMTS